MSIHTAEDRKRQSAVEIKQLLAERENKHAEYRTKTYVDEPMTSAVGPDGTLYITMKSGRVWYRSGENGRASVFGEWGSIWSPLPDTDARETFDEIAQINRELRDLGHEEED